MENEQELSLEQKNELSAKKIREAKALTAGTRPNIPIHSRGCGNAIENSGSIHANLSEIDAYARRVVAKHEAKQ